MKLTVTVLAVCVLLSGCVVAAAAVSYNHGGVSSPPVPVFHNVGMDWQYTDANGTLLGHYHFRWYANLNVMRFQQFNKENTVMWFTNWTMGMTRPVTLYYSDNSCCIAGTADKTSQKTLADNQAVVLPAPPSTARYVGQARVDGVMCSGFEFVWPQDNLPVVLWTTTDPVTNQSIPVRTTLPHNGRYLKYNEFTTTPDEAFYVRDFAYYQTHCTLAKGACPATAPTPAAVQTSVQMSP